MAVLHMMVGLPGAGKSHLATRLARDLPALRLSADDLHIALFGDDTDHPDHDRRHDRIEGHLWTLALATLQLGTDVILDFGFWSRSERQTVRRAAAQAGFASRLHVPTDPGLTARLARIAARSDGFAISPETMAGYEPDYEPPLPDELQDMPPEPAA